MPNPCAFFDTGTAWAKDIYTTHHNPAVYYDDIEGGRYSEAFHQAPKAECIRRVIATGGTGPNDMSRFNAALSRGTIARFNMVIPNDCQQGHDPCGTPNPLRQFDTFLRREVPRIEASPAFRRNGLILITYDEWGDATPRNHRVAFLAIGPQVRPGIYRATGFSHYSLLRTLEDGFGVHGHLRNAATARPISQIWRS
jgi:phosphatidylinositol-3-phosphatase